MTLWKSAFDHQAKKAISAPDKAVYEQVAKADGFRIKWLDARPYKRSIALARWQNHHRYGRLWLETVKDSPHPDIILASLPSHLLAAAASKWGRTHGVPVLIDVRDAWPLFFVYIVPPGLRFAARRFLASEFRATQQALADATHVISMSDSLLEWGLREGKRAREQHDQVFYLGAEAPSSMAPRHPDARSPVVVLFAGTLGKFSDPGLCIRLAEAAVRRDLADDFRFLIAGAGPGRAAVESAARRLPNLEFLGWLEKDALDDALAGSHICVVPRPSTPHPEGLGQLPNKFFGYLAQGKAILTDEEGEVAGLTHEWKCGFVVREGSVDEALSALETYRDLDDQQRVALAQNARRAFEAFGRASDIDAKFADYVQGLLDGKA